MSRFNNTELEKLPNAKLLKLEISTFRLFCLFCQYYDSISFKATKSNIDISLEVNSMEAELEQNESLCLQGCCRLDLMNHQHVPKQKFQIFKVSLAKTAGS